MPVRRVFYNGLLQERAFITLCPKESKHLVVSLRMQEGTTIEVVNGCGVLAKCTIALQDKRKGVVVKVCSLQKERKRPYELTLYQAITRPSRIETIVEKGVELGVTKFCFFSPIKGEKYQLSKRLESIAIAAVKQCGRLWLPVFTEVDPIMQWSQPFTCAFFGDVGVDAKPFPVGIAQQKDVSIIIGPEGGFSDKEVDQLKALGVKGVSVSHSVLRSDTAAIAALSLAMVPTPDCDPMVSD